MGKQDRWTQEELTRLRELASTKENGQLLSATQIAARMGRKRSQISGQAHRKGISIGGGRKGKRPPPPEEKPKSLNRKPPERQALPPPEEDEIEFAVVTSAHPDLLGPIPWPYDPKCAAIGEERRPAECKWPIGEVGDPYFGFCGKPALPGQPYCQHHSEAKKRKKKKPKQNGNSAGRPSVVRYSPYSAILKNDGWGVD